MKSWTIAAPVAALVAMAVLAGCQKRQGEPRQADRYDQKVDNVTPMQDVSPDPLVAGDQSKANDLLRQRASGSSGSGQSASTGGATTPPTTGPTTPATGGGELQAARAVVGEAFAAARGADEAKLIALFDEPEAWAFRNARSGAGFPAKRDAVMAEIQSRLGVEPDANSAQALGVGVMNIFAPSAPMQSFSSASVDAIDLTAQGQTVLFDVAGESYAAVPVGAGMKLQWGPSRRASLRAAAASLVPALTVEKVQAALAGGSLTAEDVNARIAAAHDEADRDYKLAFASMPDTTPAPPTPPVEPSPMPAPPAVEPNDDTAPDANAPATDDAGMTE